jgi:hypothetical protein
MIGLKYSFQSSCEDVEMQVAKIQHKMTLHFEGVDHFYSVFCQSCYDGQRERACQSPPWQLQVFPGSYWFAACFYGDLKLTIALIMLLA